MKMAQPDLIGTLRRLPLFTDLTESELVLIARRVTMRHLRPREIVFSEGDPCRELLIVRDGRVNLLKTAANGRQQLLSVERAGNSLSEISVFDGDPYPATARP
jgi:CRP-like cAMP-binding protein